MNTQIDLLSDDALDAVTGGVSNNGQGNLLTGGPGALLHKFTPGKPVDNNGGLFGDFLEGAGIVLLTGAIIAAAA